MGSAIESKRPAESIMLAELRLRSFAGLPIAYATA
jgi:hypothetical protein